MQAKSLEKSRDGLSKVINYIRTDRFISDQKPSEVFLTNISVSISMYLFIAFCIIISRIKQMEIMPNDKQVIPVDEQT